MLLRSSPPANMPKMRRKWRAKLAILCVLVGVYGAFMWHVTHTKPRVLMQRVLIPVDVVSDTIKVGKAPPAPPVPLIDAPHIEVPPPHLNLN
ncbi:hypothetical protein [Acetobacter orientalis]|uniref:Uncharacterized protein n=1 Tax=Acetobacter orientalis TaxID=146474 RepID=A0A252A270_9PROT|nr:hypothetical protein [Acetobacter orientalis]OUI81898.1 hypothetical protein HK12_04235 [Acetobacter orientalis]